MATLVLQFGEQGQERWGRIELEVTALGQTEAFSEWLLANPGHQALFSRLIEEWVGGPVISVRRIQECEACPAQI
jgi:hypothetical protein